MIEFTEQTSSTTHTRSTERSVVLDEFEQLRRETHRDFFVDGTRRTTGGGDAFHTSKRVIQRLLQIQHSQIGLHQNALHFRGHSQRLSEGQG